MRKRGDFVIRQGETAPALIFAAGPKTYDLIHLSGFVERLKQSWRDEQTRIADEADFHGNRSYYIEQLTKEADKAREERRTGARVKRGAIWPSR
jgi:hypothetical protein